MICLFANVIVAYDGQSLVFYFNGFHLLGPNSLNYGCYQMSFV